MNDRTIGPEQCRPLTLACVRDAHCRIREKISRTPVMTSDTLDAATGARLCFKCENFQKTGAIKARGAVNAVFALTNEEAARGVITHSSGNHAVALACAAQLRGIPAHIVMPDNAPVARQVAVRRYGGRIVHCEPALEAREAAAARVISQTSATFIHPYDDLRVMAGQGTAALELLQDVATLDVILCPVGGGGLLSGTAVATKSIDASVAVIGVCPACADGAARAFVAGQLVQGPNGHTIAETLGTSLSARTLAEIRRHVDDIVTVSEEAIVRAMRTLWEVMKIVVEPSGAVAFAALVENRLPVEGKRVGIIVSGGNLDLEKLPWTR